MLQQHWLKADVQCLLRKIKPFKKIKSKIKMYTMAEQKSYSFQTENLHYNVIEEKGEKSFFITGHISTKDVDLYNDVVTENGLKSMLAQLKSKVIKLDFDHEAWRDSPNILPVGKIVDARIDQKGLWVKAELNDASPKFKSLWKSIKKGFVDAFSIAFKPIKTTMKAMGDTTVRLLEDVELLNVALTGVPVNAHAKITDVMMKAIVEFEHEVKNMSEDETNTQTPPAEETPTQADPTPAVPEVKSVAVEDFNKQVEEMKSLKEAVEGLSELKSLKDSFDKQAEELKSVKKELETIKKSPVLKSIMEPEPANPAATAGQEAEIKSIINQL